MALSWAKLVATIDSTGILRFAPDAQLDPSTAGTLARWRTTRSRCSRYGSGYDKVTTAETSRLTGSTRTAAPAKRTITIQRTSDGSIVRTLSGGTRPTFSPDISTFAEWTPSPNVIRCGGSRTARWCVPRHSGGADARGCCRASPGRHPCCGQRLCLPQARRHLGPEGSGPVLGNFGRRVVQTLTSSSLGVTTPWCSRQRQAVPLRPLRRRVRRRGHTLRTSHHCEPAGGTMALDRDRQSATNVGQIRTWCRCALTRITLIQASTLHCEPHLDALIRAAAWPRSSSMD